MASYEIVKITDSAVIIVDLDQGRSVTNDAENVVAELHKKMAGGLGRRRVYYRDTMGRFDELKHEQGRFIGFAPCTDSQQTFLADLALTPQ